MTPAQPGIAADRFAHEIVGFLKVIGGALAAAECQPVGPPPSNQKPEYAHPTCSCEYILDFTYESRRWSKL